MGHPILSLNQSKRLAVSLFMLFCFSMFSAWQMGFIYFMGPSLTLNGRTPLPISMDNVTLIIVTGYVLAIIYMIVLPHFVVWAERLTTIASLITILAMFMPLPDGVLKMVVYAHIFFCCFMIGFESFIMINFFSEESTIKHLTVAYAAALFIIAVVQNDFVPISFPVFRWVVVAMLIMLLTFSFYLPSGAEACPRYVKKTDGIVMPKNLFSGLLLLAVVSCLMTLCGAAAAGDVKHGVSIAYFADAVASLAIFWFYKKNGANPLRIISVFMSLSAIGFLALYASEFVPALTYPACVLIGLGFAPCQFLPLYGLTMMKTYPSRFIVPVLMTIAVVTVVIQSALVEAFRSNAAMLYLVYMAITVLLLIIYMNLEPYIVHTLARRFPAKSAAEEIDFAQDNAEDAIAAEKAVLDDSSKEENILDSLTKREKEVLELIGCGYTNSDIAKILFISEHTVNDYTKKIYRKLDVHSRHAAARIINRYGSVL